MSGLTGERLQSLVQPAARGRPGLALVEGPGMVGAMNYAFVAVLLAMAVSGIAVRRLALRSQRRTTTGSGKGRLPKCRRMGSCVCSEPGTPDRAAVEPLSFSGARTDAWQRALDAVKATGGIIEDEQPDRARATYRTRVFGFVDDVGLRLVSDESVIHIRSASRVGRSDLGANRRRVEGIRKAFGR